MIKQIYIKAFFLSSVLIAGCNDDFLEEKKDYEKYNEEIFTNEVGTGWYIDRMYYDFFAGYKHPGWTVVGMYNIDRSRLTEEIGGTVHDWTDPNKMLVEATDCPIYYGTSMTASVSNNPYTRIRFCNFLIEKIEAVGQDLSQSFRDQAKGQMYFLRAWQYFDLLRTYGGVPIVTSVQEASTADESIKLPRATSAEVVSQIVADFDKAAALLPSKWETSYGRFTKGAALAMKSRVLLTFASPLFNPDWENTSSQRWKDALDAGLAAEAQLAADNYSLCSSAKEWANMFLVDNAFCKEAIIVFLCSPNTSDASNNGWENSIRLTSQGGAGGVAAPKAMIDLFPMADGSRPTAENGYDDVKFFMNRDPRFYRTFAFSGCKWGNKSNQNGTVWAYRYQKTDNKTYVYADNNQIMSPAFVRKMSNPSADNSSYRYSGTDIFEYRFAELLLNIAECYAATNNIPKCIEYLGRVRQRVGIPSTNNYGIGTLSSSNAAIAACLYERQVELAYEGKRFWDAQRWLLYDGICTASSSANTCAKLGLAPINGTTRTGNYWQARVNSNTDPVPADAKNAISIDPDASNFSSQLQSLAALYDSYFKRVPTDRAMDLVNGSPVNISFKPNYYLFGLPNGLLSNNPWLEQTIGWNDIYGTPGTFNYQQ